MNISHGASASARRDFVTLLFPTDSAAGFKIGINCVLGLHHLIILSYFIMGVYLFYIFILHYITVNSSCYQFLDFLNFYRQNWQGFAYQQRISLNAFIYKSEQQMLFNSQQRYSLGTIQIYISYKQVNMFNLTQNYEKLWKAIIRPPRAQYKKQDLGPAVFRKNGMKIKRTQVTLTNKRGYKLVGSHYQPFNRPCKMLPCVIYLHGNSSCQIEAQYCLSSILCHDVSLFAFDFAGCGISEGEYISLGYHEREDVQVVFNYLRSIDSVSSIGIWGRSMGAVTALMYADRNHQIGCLVLDSPFSNLEALCKQLAKRFVTNLSAFSGIALTFLSKTIKQKNSFQIQQIDPLKNVSKAYIPALFIAAKNDDFILPHHTDILYEKYSGQKQKLLVEGDHNSKREQFVLDKISSFFYFGLCVKDLVKPDPAFIEQQKKKKSKQSEIKQQQIKGFTYSHVNYDHDDHQDNQQELAKALELSLALAEKNRNKQADKKQDKKQ